MFKMIIYICKDEVNSNYTIFCHITAPCDRYKGLLAEVSMYRRRLHEKNKKNDYVDGGL